MGYTESIIVELPGGRISAVCKNGIVRARGLKYASADRFQHPVPYEAWEGVMDCTSPAPIAPQAVPSRLDSVTGPITRGPRQQEDCLHTTITTTKNSLSVGQGLPVMVFFHGGAYVSGGADLDCYEASALAIRGVVVVNISHHLGILGYQPIPGVAPANLGLFDQIAALEWVQKNISAFGGDPHNVTLFGQSAGADSIFCLMIAQTTTCLFHKAILQSPPLGLRMLDREPMIEALGRVAIERLADDSKPRTADEILLLQTELMLAAKSYPSSLMAFGPSLGHEPLPSLQQVPERIDLIAKTTPILIGYTKHEGAPFLSMSDSWRPYFVFPLVGSLLKWLATYLISSSAFQLPARRFHRQYLGFGGTASLFRFNWYPSGSPLGSTHCLDLPFVLGSWSTWKDAPMIYDTDCRVVVEDLGDKLKDLWVSFAKGEQKDLGNFDITGNTHRGDIKFY